MSTMSSYYNDGASSGAALLTFSIIGFIVGMIVGFAVTGLLTMGIFRKAGKPQWAAFVPFYNYYVLLDIVGRPLWWIWLFVGGYVLLFFPILNLFVGWIGGIGLLVLNIFVLNDLAKSFGKDAGWTVGLVLLGVVFLPILGYGESRYLGQGALMGPRGQGYAGQYPATGYPQPQQYGQPSPYGQQYGQQPGYSQAPPQGQPEQPKPGETQQ
jgi:hypothetical protein